MSAGLALAGSLVALTLPARRADQAATAAVPVAGAGAS
ncbi:MAG: hypothetical protein JWO02_857 [Solirubrobacterales bacterium]|nr:hypothetical protein [Solirubrobacterales bacterium]